MIRVHFRPGLVRGQLDPYGLPYVSPPPTHVDFQDGYQFRINQDNSVEITDRQETVVAYILPDNAVYVQDMDPRG